MKDSCVGGRDSSRHLAPCLRRHARGERRGGEGRSPAKAISEGEYFIVRVKLRVGQCGDFARGVGSALIV